MDSWITVNTVDGPMRSYLTRPSGRGGPHPGVVVLQEAFGVNAYVKSVCDRLADAGYTALAPELFHRTGTHVEIEYADRPRVMDALQKLSNATLEEDCGAAVTDLRNHAEVDPKRIAVLGFCMGGFAALLTALHSEVAAAIAYYPGLLVHPRPGMKIQPILDRLPDMRAATQIHFGAEDQGIPAADRARVKEALDRSPCVHQIVEHAGADHGFHSHDRAPTYHPHAAEEAWHETLGWLRENLA
jgi:carboxymethylenebutenolidase